MVAKEADSRFLHGILVALVLATLATGVMAALATVSASQPATSAIGTQDR
jgi:hypothetical protein